MSFRALMSCYAFVLMVALACACPVHAMQQATPIAADKIAALQAQLDESLGAASPARQKLALRRAIREAVALVEQNADAPNRFEALAILFRTQQALIKIDDTPANRADLLNTCRQLVQAPRQYAALRLDADLLLSQAELARQGADPRARADALRPLVQRYVGTEVQAKVIRIAMLIALESGDTSLVDDLREVIAQHCASDLDMILFQREKLAGQVFGAPFVAALKDADGNLRRLPMDGFGLTTALFFWSSENNGLQHVQELANAYKARQDDALGRLRILSINLDQLPDAGQAILKQNGIDWPALHLPGGKDNPLYLAYANRNPALITLSPTGHAAIFMAGGNSDTSGYERWTNSALAREWTKPNYTSHLQAITAAEPFIIDPTGFDPACPPELKALNHAKPTRLTAQPGDVPDDQLHAIQACFTPPPHRYRTPAKDSLANYQKADTLCQQAIAQHPAAANLWIVRNRRIVALMGMWRLNFDHALLHEAAKEANALINAPHPKGADLLARFCLTRHALHQDDADPHTLLDQLASATDPSLSQGPAIAAAAILALDLGDRPRHEHYRRQLLDQHLDNPVLWNLTNFLLDRYHRYWLYREPFTAGWTYGRRQSFFLAAGQPDDAHRTLRAQLQTLDGQTLRIPEDTLGKWTVIEFTTKPVSGLPRGTTTFAQARPDNDAQVFSAYLGGDADALKTAISQQTKPDPNAPPFLLVPGGMNNPLIHQLGILNEEERSNILILKPDGSVANMLSGLVMASGHRGNIIQNILHYHDELAIQKAIENNDLQTAQRLAFAHAPLPEPVSPDARNKPKPTPIDLPHLRGRMRVYLAQAKWNEALADAQEVHLEISRRDGWLSMRTPELDEIEDILHTIQSNLPK